MRLWLTKLIFGLGWDIKGNTERFFMYQKERCEKYKERTGTGLY